MVYGKALTLPGEFLEASTPPGDNFLQLLRERMSRFQPPPTRPVEVKPASQQEAALHKADFVYVKMEPWPLLSHLSTQDRTESSLGERRPSTWTSEAETRSYRRTG
jgi:hypothetical protein